MTLLVFYIFFNLQSIECRSLITTDGEKKPTLNTIKPRKEVHPNGH